MAEHMAPSAAQKAGVRFPKLTEIAARHIQKKVRHEQNAHQQVPLENQTSNPQLTHPQVMTQQQEEQEGFQQRHLTHFSNPLVIQNGREAAVRVSMTGRQPPVRFGQGGNVSNFQQEHEASYQNDIPGFT